MSIHPPDAATLRRWLLTTSDDDLAQHLRGQLASDPDVTVELLRGLDEASRDHTWSVVLTMGDGSSTRAEPVEVPIDDTALIVALGAENDEVAPVLRLDVRPHEDGEGSEILVDLIVHGRSLTHPHLVLHHDLEGEDVAFDEMGADGRLRAVASSPERLTPERQVRIEVIRRGDVA